MQHFLARLGAVALILAGLSPAQAAAQQDRVRSQNAGPRSAPPALEVYGALPALELVALSPNGDRLARITVANEERMLVVSRIATGDVLAAARVGETKVRDLEWIDDDRILILATSTDSIPAFGVPRSEFTFGLTFDVRTRTIKRILDTTPGVAPILQSRPQIRNVDGQPAVFVRGVSVTGQPRVSLYQVDPASGRGRMVHEMDYLVDGFVLDPDGQVIAKSVFEPDRGRWSLVLREGSGFRTAWVTETRLDIPSLEGLGTRPGTVLVNAARPDLDGGRNELLVYEVDLSTGEWRRPPFAAEPDALLFHPHDRRLIGAVHAAGEGARYEFLDAAAGARWGAISRAFVGRSPALASWSDDLGQAVVFTGGPGSSGVYQLIDFKAGRADIVGEPYPGIGETWVGSVRPVEYAAADGLTIHGFLTLPPGVAEPRNLPLVILPHGGPQAHDAGDFDWFAQALTSRGYAVFQPNFRGSSGYGMDFVEAGYGEWGRKMQSDVSDGVRWLAGQGWIDPRRACVVGASYGGYVALAGVTLEQGLYRCAVSFGGVSDLRRMVQDVSRRQGRRDTQAVHYWNRFMGAERLGDRSLDERSPARLAAQADAPVLLIHGRDDTVVGIDQSRAMATALRTAGKPHELIELRGEDHWLSRADTRVRMLTETARFLQVHNPPD